MKRKLSTVFIYIVTILSLTLTLTACTSDKDGTYYPDKSEMSYNLIENGYQTYSTSILVGGGEGAFLSATKNEDYIKFYWLDNADDCEYYYNLLEQDNPNCNVFVKIENDEKFGNIVYCGTENAITAAGIKVVEVKVNVKV